MTSLTAELQDAELQQALTSFIPQKNNIIQNFTTFGDAIAGLPSTDPAVQSQAIQTVFNLLNNTENVNAISESLLNIYDLLDGSGEFKGIIAYQADLCNDSVTIWATDPANIQDLGQFPGDTDVLPGSNYCRILLEYPTVLNSTLIGTVLPNLQAMLAVQIQGLSLLISAWTGTSQEPQLTTHAGNIYAQLQSMNGVFPAITASSALDSLIENLIANTGTLGSAIESAFVVPVQDGTGSMNPPRSDFNPTSFPLSGTWIHWGDDTRTGGDNYWQGDTCFYGDMGSAIQSPIQWGAAANSICHLNTASFSDGDRYVWQVNGGSFYPPLPISTGVLIPSPGTIMGAAPDTYVSLMSALASIAAPSA